MKPFLPVLLLLAGGTRLVCQVRTGPDTLLQINFERPNDTVMLLAPTGKDTQWVNWDGDKQPTACGRDTVVPGNWYIESDLGDNAQPPANFAYTSCSWLLGSKANNNWLITPPVFIRDSSYNLAWRSLAFQGPQYLDGYKILVSKRLNLPDTLNFRDTIFKAAQMLGNNEPYTLDLSDYQFSEGYIHANGYQNASYYFLDPKLGPVGMYHGRLEPHALSLSKYTGDTIYIAFLHDSHNDYMVQVDDIVVSNTVTAVREWNQLTRFEAFPNPCTNLAILTWELSAAVPDVRLVVWNQIGQLVREIPFHRASHVQYRLDMQSYPAGIYYLSLLTPYGQATRRLCKM